MWSQFGKHFVARNSQTKTPGFKHLFDFSVVIYLGFWIRISCLADEFDKILAFETIRYEPEGVWDLPLAHPMQLGSESSPNAIGFASNEIPIPPLIIPDARCLSINWCPGVIARLRSTESKSVISEQKVSISLFTNQLCKHGLASLKARTHSIGAMGGPVDWAYTDKSKPHQIEDTFALITWAHSKG